MARSGPQSQACANAAELQHPLPAIFTPAGARDLFLENRILAVVRDVVNGEFFALSNVSRGDIDDARRRWLRYPVQIKHARLHNFLGLAIWTARMVDEASNTT